MLDMPLEESLILPVIIPNTCFNPSYAGYASGSHRTKKHPYRQLHVSILLMLDMPLEVNAVLPSENASYSFNPSYAGYASGSVVAIFKCCAEDLFQSFLCWICLWKRMERKQNARRRLVSILLMLDMPLEELKVSILFPPKSQFQSFLCWICLWKLKLTLSCSWSRKVSILLMLDMPLEANTIRSLTAL